MFIYSEPHLKMPNTVQIKPELWIVEEPFWFRSRRNGVLMVPPAGKGSRDDMLANPVWTTDYGSIPRIFWNILSPTYYAAAYILHDWLYASEAFPRSVCDSILLEALKALGANWITRRAVWLAVRAGGGSVWSRHKLKKVEALKEYAALMKVPPIITVGS